MILTVVAPHWGGAAAMASRTATNSGSIFPGRTRGSRAPGSDRDVVVREAGAELLSSLPLDLVEVG